MVLQKGDQNDTWIALKYLLQPTDLLLMSIHTVRTVCYRILYASQPLFWKGDESCFEALFYIVMPCHNIEK